MRTSFLRCFALWIGLACIGLTWSNARRVTAGEADKRLDVYWVDVEGGAATLIVTPRGESILIDSGNPGRRDPQRIVEVAHGVAGLRQIDFLITTHYHGDHFGGAATLAEVMPIRHVYDNGEFPLGIERPDKAYLDFKAEDRHVLEVGARIPLDAPAAGDDAPEFFLQCLAARQTFIDPASDSQDNAQQCEQFQPKERDGSDNANSIVLLLGLGPFRLFDAGDLTWNMEHKLVCPRNLVGKVDVYQVTHHGLDASNNPVLVRTLAPTVAVMNNGVTKGCEPETFATLSSCKSIQAIYQMHKNLREDSTNNTRDELIANLEKECQAHYIQLSVAPDGKSYVVRIPANSHEATYQTR